MTKTTKKPKTTSAKSSASRADSSKTISARAEKTAAAPAKVSARTDGSKPNHVLLELVKPGAKTVCVAGSFNEWQPEKSPLVPRGNGRWVGDLTVKPGRHEYLFVVDGQWVPDPNAKESVANPFGGQNSVLLVSA
jgi:1,4-alpha-glucan branching enzyme